MNCKNKTCTNTEYVLRCKDCKRIVATAEVDEFKNEIIRKQGLYLVAAQKIIQELSPEAITFPEIRRMIERRAYD